MLTYDMSRRGELPLYVFLYESIKNDLLAGKILPQEKLPSKRRLAQHLGVSLITVQAAYDQLAAEGYIAAVARKGYFALEVSRAASNPASPLIPEGLSRSANAATSKQTYAFDLTSGAMPSDIFPFASWTKALRDTLAQEPKDNLLFDNNPMGTQALREAIAIHLRQTRGLIANPENILIGSGAQTLYNLLIQLLNRNMHVGIEDPGYQKLALIYERNGLNVSHISLDADGINMDGVRASQANVLHITPSHQFPTGIVMPVSRRYELLAWATEEKGRYIVEDDYDCEFRLAGRPVPTLQGIDESERVIYTNTFTKSLGPAFRIAYMVLPDHLARKFRDELGFYSCTVPVVDQLALARFMRHGDFERHLNRTKTRCRSVRNAFITSLKASSAASFLECESIDAGLHFILKVRTERPPCEVIDALACEGVRAKALSDYAQTDKEKADEMFVRLVIQYAALSEAEAREAAGLVARALTSCCR